MTFSNGAEKGYDNGKRLYPLRKKLYDSGVPEYEEHSYDWIEHLDGQAQTNWYNGVDGWTR